MRDVGRFLRASWDRSIDSAGRVDLITGLVLTLVGRLMNVDFAVIALAVVTGVLLIRLLVLSPAAMWAEAEARRGAVTTPSIVGTVETGGVVNINIYGPSAYNASTETEPVANEPETTQ